MIKKDSITFTVWENDPPLDIQLEPEAFNFTVKAGEQITFAVKNPSQEFSWTVRYDIDGVQLFPETMGNYERIELFRNGELTNELDFLYED